MSIFREENADYITALPDLKQYMDIIHNITEPGDHVIGNPRESWNRLTFKKDLKISLEELKEIHERFPKLFQPVFQLQYQMMCRFMGETWWSWKKNQCLIRKEDQEAEKKKEEIARKKQSAETRAKLRKIKRNMGFMMYYMCPCFRTYYDPTKEEEDPEEADAERARQRAIARKKAAMAAKNPETPASAAFASKADPTRGGTEEYVVKKVFKTQRQREARAVSRAERYVLICMYVRVYVLMLT
jgi:hypothetical protein